MDGVLGTSGSSRFRLKPHAQVEPASVLAAQALGSLSASPQALGDAVALCAAGSGPLTSREERSKLTRASHVVDTTLYVVQTFTSSSRVSVCRFNAAQQARAAAFFAASLAPARA